jgi:hypothetical protein
LRQVEDETVGGLGRRRKRVFGALTLLVCNLPLRDRDFALPVGKPGERDCYDDEIPQCSDALWFDLANVLGCHLGSRRCR